MDDSLRNALNNQGNHELYAALSYEAMAYWCEVNDFAGFAEFFFAQAKEELEHAGKFFKHMADRGVQPHIGAQAEPANAFKAVSEVAELAQTLERRNSEQIKACYEVAMETKDYESFPLLLEFIEEQVEEEAWAARMVALVRRSECPGAIFNLDRHIVKELG